ncbi:NAD-dependent epimerase/dehydratase family protein [Nocardioides hwasunensis]|uniref:NAD-dependent epimerase/dehydratase family protein n=1 Tax=Nocardioides hwasunensis TaxID=397258 RepID=A0ABR8MKU0_9ACTN|nr:NAD-dependent epimerase/dehydratase family protein [Nocardioides hwasunensis]MBD3916648.1 NAD-dependent epimerase/dehydratase family protein [Nocardioides hwasunensis]
MESMMKRRSVALLGGSGFVGSAVAEVLDTRDCDVVRVVAPRLTTKARSIVELTAEIDRVSEAVAKLADELRGCDVVVNAAGDPDASSLEADSLFGANALLPYVVLTAAREAGVSRFVHVSSAVVQNDREVLDESESMDPFSTYSASKVAGERVIASGLGTTPAVVRYRPPSVHAPGRRVTRMIGRIASSPLSSVARPGSQATPQALLVNVADAISYLALAEHAPPPVVIHPWEGVTAGGLMEWLGGGRSPKVIPAVVARTLVRLAKTVGRIHRPTAANARRLELLWLGQRQASSWLTQDGWRPPVGHDGWQDLAG